LGSWVTLLHFLTSSLFTSSLPRHRLHLRQQVTKLAVVDLDAVVEVQRDALVGVVAELLVVAAQLVELPGELVALLLQALGPGAAAGGLDVVGRGITGGSSRDVLCRSMVLQVVTVKINQGEAKIIIAPDQIAILDAEGRKAFRVQIGPQIRMPSLRQKGFEVDFFCVTIGKAQA
jgi:hypothetical protein